MIKMRAVMVKGSLTVEAAFIVPIVLFCLLFVIQTAITLYQDTTERMQVPVWCKEYDPVLEFCLRAGKEREWN